MNTTPTELTDYRITCRMTEEAAALERLCQVVRVRGFRITRMAVESTEGVLDITLALTGSRPLATLKNQLEKLHTVVQVTLETSKPEALVVSRTA